MALPLAPGLTPPEVAFLCEMELVTVIPRQRLPSLELLAVSWYSKSKIQRTKANLDQIGPNSSCRAAFSNPIATLVGSTLR